MWNLEYYELPSGRCLALDFLEEQNAKTERPYLTNALDQLENNGNRLGIPQVKYLDDGIFELRVKIVKKNYRMFYFFFLKNTIVITHGFIKKSGSVPQHQINLAKKYRNDYEMRQK